MDTFEEECVGRLEELYYVVIGVKEYFDFNGLGFVKEAFEQSTSGSV